MMENGKMQDGHPDDPDLHVAQLQALWAELKVGLKGVAQEISALQQSNVGLEEQISECKRETAEKILSLRNTLNTLQEDTSTALTQISDLSSRQKELKRDLELLPRAQPRKLSRAEDLFESHTFPCSQTQLSLVQHYISSLPNTKNSEQDACSSRAHSRTSLWKERRDSRDLIELNNQELSQRQVAALELLESERLYVSYLSLLLKANISFNGCENINLKDKRPFPSSLRFLIQQHLDLLHLLQERVLKSHWQGIMGDVFLRLTSRESDFLDNYLSYLKELPECISVLSLLPSNSVKPVVLQESDITGDDTRPSLCTLLLKPVRRIPEYVELLQSLLCQTESEHPDYYLLLVCMQHLRSFSTHHSNLLQHIQELVTCSHSQSLQGHTHNPYKQLHDRVAHARKDHGSSAHRDPAHGPRRTRKAVRRYPDWEAEPQRFHPDIPFVSDLETRHKPPLTPLQRIPETERPGSALADAMQTFVPCAGEDSHCSSSSHSTDSSIDIAFVRCSPALNSDHQSRGRGRSGAGGAYRPSRGGVSPDSSGMVKPRPLQAAQRKSKSLNGLQLDNIDSHSQPVRSPAHPRLVRQSSAKPRLRESSPERHHETHTVAEELTQQLHKDTTTPIWEEFKSREVEHTPLCERSRKESKGFRSSFKKLFKKKSSGESKVEKAEGQSSAELESGRSNRTTDVSRGTAV